MKHIWAPWRMGYILSEKEGRCIFCGLPGEDNDETNFILFRGSKNFVIMNSYPYNPGHLMVVPYRHVATPDKMRNPERHEHADMVSQCLVALRRALNPAGFNVGVNIGRIAGAGIEDHTHTHIVPRWQGDTNFMPVFGDIRVVAEALTETYQKLREEF